jgi:hypothetical protein
MQPLRLSWFGIRFIGLSTCRLHLIAVLSIFGMTFVTRYAHACVSAIGHYLEGFATGSKMMRLPSLDLTALTRG